MSTAESSASIPYDAILVVGFGGPEHRDDVIPFLENVLRGRNVPRERMLEVAEHYNHFDGISPLNGQVRDLIAALGPELKRRGIDLPIYWGNRNWHPMLADTMAKLVDNQSHRALALVLAAYSSYSSCRQYREDIQRAREAAGELSPAVDKVRVFYNHPDFIAANVERVRDALVQVPADRRASVHLAFTAHSIPNSMADRCRYVEQLTETCQLIAEAVGIEPERWRLVYQSRSGRPTDPWLEPDIVDHLRDLRKEGRTDVVVHPVGFLSDHMEVLYDLDDEAQRACAEIGLNMVRAATVGTHPTFIAMLGELLEERILGRIDIDRRAVGLFGPDHDVCPVDCCLPPPRPPARPGTGS